MNEPTPKRDPFSFSWPTTDHDFEKVPGPSFETLWEAWHDGDTFFEKLGNTITETAAGRNTVGRVLGSAIDVGLIFAPYGGRLDNARQTAKAALGLQRRKFQHNPNPMDKPRYLSKTVWSSIIIAATAILQAVGVDFVSNPETMQTIYNVAYSLAGAFGLYGLRSAVGEQIKRSEGE